MAERITFTESVEACRICDQGKDWREIPFTSCRHDTAENRVIRRVTTVPLEDLRATEQLLDLLLGAVKEHREDRRREGTGTLQVSCLIARDQALYEAASRIRAERTSDG